MKPRRVTEIQVAYVVLQIAAEQPAGFAGFDLIRSLVPKYLHLSLYDLTQSTTRPGEALWEQQIRNIRSHHAVPGNYLCEGYLQHVSKKGYRITGAGRKHLNAMRLHLRAERERQWSLPV